MPPPVKPGRLTPALAWPMVLPPRVPYESAAALPAAAVMAAAVRSAVVRILETVWIMTGQLARRARGHAREVMKRAAHE